MVFFGASSLSKACQIVFQMGVLMTLENGRAAPAVEQGVNPFKIRGKKRLKRMVKLLKNGEREAALEQWEQLLRSKYAGADSSDIVALIAEVLRRTQTTVSHEVKYHSARIEFYNQLARAVRQEIASLRNGYEAPDMCLIEELPDFSPDAVPVPRRGQLTLTPGNREAYLNDLGARLETLVSDMQYSGEELVELTDEQGKAWRGASDLARELHEVALVVLQDPLET